MFDTAGRRVGWTIDDAVAAPPAYLLHMVAGILMLAKGHSLLSHSRFDCRKAAPEQFFLVTSCRWGSVYFHGYAARAE